MKETIKKVVYSLGEFAAIIIMIYPLIILTSNEKITVDIIIELILACCYDYYICKQLINSKRKDDYE